MDLALTLYSTSYSVNLKNVQGFLLEMWKFGLNIK